MIIFFTHSPLPDFWKKSSGEACYARGGQNLEFWGLNWGVRRSVNATRNEAPTASPKDLYFMTIPIDHAARDNRHSKSRDYN